MKLTKQDYQNALEIYNVWFKEHIEISFSKYMEEWLDELEQPEIPMYRCIQLPPANNGSIKIGNLYAENYCIVGFNLSDLPFHFELVEPEPELEKITWDEVRTVISNTLGSVYWPPIFDFLPLVKVSNRIKKDHL